MKKIINFLLLAVVVFTTSCISEQPWDNPNGNNTGDGAQVTLRLQTPGGFNAPNMRSLTFAQENQIDDIYVLVFNNATPNVLIDIKKAKISSQSTVDPTGGISGVATFTITMPPNTGTGATESSRLVVLANVESILEETVGIDDTSGSIGDSYADVMSAIYTSITGTMFPSGSTDRIPMWGETEQIVIAPGNNNQILRLMRAIARIDVGIGSPARTTSPTSDEWTWSGMERDGTTPIPFELQEVYVISPSNRFAVVPDVTLLSAGNPTLPTGIGKFTLAQSESLFRFSGDDIAGVTNNRGGWTSRSIYIPEADVKINTTGISGDGDHTNRIAVIVGGDFNSSGTTTYYRVDFAPDGRNLVNVLRNHLYQFNIAKVSGAGYPTVKEAYESMAMNMEVEIIDWDEEELIDIEFEGNNYFSIARREVVFSPFGGITEKVSIRTNVSDFSMWELAGTATNEIQANGNLTFSSGNFAYQYTLIKTGSDTYTLEIYNPFNNVTNSPGDRKEQWQIRAGRMRIAFDVSQQWTDLYISVIDGSSARLFPEGTYGTPLPINIMSLVPVAINVTYSSGSGWVNLGNTSGLAPGGAVGGLFQARLELTVPVFQYGASLDGEYNRTATVTITPQGQPSVVYTIIQESPYIIFNPNTSIINIQRPATPPSTPTSTGITVITNILPDDLNLARTADVGLAADAALVQLADPPGLEHVDALRPRYGRFTVHTDLTTAVLPTNGFGAEFSVTPEAGKYGDLSPTTVRVAVPTGTLNFNIFWWQGSFDGGTTFPWNVTRYTNETGNFVFPWNTTQVDFDVVSNVGLTEATSVTGNGILNLDAETTDAEGNTQYAYSFLINNNNFNVAGDYSLVFSTVDASPNIDLALEFTQGVQIWQRTNPAATEIAYTGLTASPITVTNNVEWNAVVSPAAATWLTLQMNNAGGYSTPTTATDMIRNDRFTAPVAFGGDYNTNLTTVLTATTPLNISVANETVLNPAWAPSRSGTITFNNLDLAATGATTTPITVRQWAPVLTHSSNNIPATIPAASAGYQITANTNLQGWGIKIYPNATNTGTPLVTQAFGTGTTINANAAASARITSFTMPANTVTAARTVSAYLFCTEFPGATNEILVGSWSQSAAAVTLTVSPGTLSFTAAANGGGNQNVTVTTNNPNYTVSSNQTWATVPSGAQTGGTFSVGINAANPTTTARTATITVTAGSETRTVTVTQAGAAATLTVTPATMSFTSVANGGGAQTATVTRNTPNYTISSNQTWATVPTGAQTAGTFNVTITSANTASTARTATITVSSPGATNRTITVTQAAAPGITVGSTRWAPANLNGSRTFAANQQALGRFYQWGTIGTTGHDWPATGGVTGWNSSNSRVAWTAATNPCPAGWRLPTQAEITALGTGTWGTLGGVNGRWFGGVNTGLFLPAAGVRNTSGTLSNAGTVGYYWSSTPDGTSFAWSLYFDSSISSVVSSGRAVGLSVRCVAE